MNTFIVLETNGGAQYASICLDEDGNVKVFTTLGEAEAERDNCLDGMVVLVDGEMPYYVISFDSGAKGIRYIADGWSNGRESSEDADQFKTKNEAETYMKEHEIVGWVSEILE